VLLADAHADLLAAPIERPLDDLLAERGVAVVDLSSWLRIDAAERERGRAAGRPRVKLCSRDELLHAALPLPAAAVGSR
jgi:ferredoxin--NADP+ reductase